MIILCMFISVFVLSLRKGNNEILIYNFFIYNNRTNEKINRDLKRRFKYFSTKR